MGVGQLSESDAVDALRLPFYSSSHPTGSHGWRNQFDLGNPDLQEYEKAAILGYDLSVEEYPDMATIKYKVKLVNGGGMLGHWGVDVQRLCHGNGPAIMSVVAVSSQ